MTQLVPQSRRRWPNRRIASLVPAVNHRSPMASKGLSIFDEAAVMMWTVYRLSLESEVLKLEYLIEKATMMRKIPCERPKTMSNCFPQNYWRPWEALHLRIFWETSRNVTDVVVSSDNEHRK
jgi:hypothetical protein